MLTNSCVPIFSQWQNENSHTECSFIESINFGTYDVNGAVSTTDSDYGNNIHSVVTPLQKAFLVISIFACFLLGVYSCYLHHSITNLLIKSLSHSTLLPPVKRRSRNSNSRGGSRGRSGQSITESSRMMMTNPKEHSLSLYFHFCKCIFISFQL